MTITDQQVVVHYPNQLFGVIPAAICRTRSRSAMSRKSPVAVRHPRRHLVRAYVSGIRVLLLLEQRDAWRPRCSLRPGVLAIAIALFVTAHSNGVFFHSTGTGVLAARGSKSELPQIKQSGVEIGRLIFT
ncbi:hypothetical protein [Gordonia sp. NPDC003585]|uniref:hypothetical protein n=1 Tax=Gordonia sp. NPDC003585 TaxID=3154275 RepID=UPI0033A8FF0C